jgi:hypothetical protein
MHEPREAAHLAAQIFQLMAMENASDREGTRAICWALVVTMITAGISKERAHEIFDQTWTLIEPRLNEFNAGARH